MSVCSTSGRPFSVVKLPCCLHINRSTFHSGRRAARLSRDTLFHQDLCTLVASCSRLSRKAKRKLARVVARAQPKTVPIQGTELVLTVTLLLWQCLATHTWLSYSTLSSPILPNPLFMRLNTPAMVQRHLLSARIVSGTEHRGAQTTADHLHLGPRHSKWHGTES